MFFNMRNKHIFLIFSLLLVIGCNKYNKLLKSSDYQLKYQKALEYYNEQDFIKASTLFDQIVGYYKGTSKSDSVSYFHAMSYFMQNDYTIAAELFKEFTKTYSRSKFVEECDYLYGYCFYQLSPRSSLDQEFTQNSIEAFEYFIYKYPESKYVADCKRLIEEMHEKLVDKAFNGAKLYYRMGSHEPLYYKSSMIALRNCIQKYPENKYREEILFMILESNYQFALRSIPEKQRERYQQTLDEYYSFIGEYPQSKHLDEANKIFEKAKVFLGI